MGETSHSMTSLYILQRGQKITLVFSVIPFVGAERLEEATEPWGSPDNYQSNKNPSTWRGLWRHDLVGLRGDPTVHLVVGRGRHVAP